MRTAPGARVPALSLFLLRATTNPPTDRGIAGCKGAVARLTKKTWYRSVCKVRVWLHILVATLRAGWRLFLGSWLFSHAAI